MSRMYYKGISDLEIAEIVGVDVRVVQTFLSGGNSRIGSIVKIRECVLVIDSMDRVKQARRAAVLSDSERKAVAVFTGKLSRLRGGHVFTKDETLRGGLASKRRDA